MSKFKVNTWNKDGLKLWGVVGLIAVSILVGVSDRITRYNISTTAVLPKSSVMVIPIEGMISASGTQWEGSMVDLFLAQLEDAKTTKSVKAVVLAINSPGGTIGATQEMFQAVQRFQSETKKPVVVSIMDIGASGAYWVAMSGQYIMAHAGSIVGSLGVITQTLDLTAVPQKYGVNVRTYKAGTHKDLLNPWRTPTKDDTYLINTMLTSVHQQFKTVLMTQRKISADRAHILADGRIYTGQDALAEGLIDEIGGLHDAVTYAGKLVNVEDPHVVYPHRGFRDWVQSFRMMAAGALSPTLSVPFGMR